MFITFKSHMDTTKSFCSFSLKPCTYCMYLTFKLPWQPNFFILTITMWCVHEVWQTPPEPSHMGNWYDIIHTPLTFCCQVTHKYVNAIPCIVDRSHILMFSYTTSCTCVCQLLWLTYHFKVIDSLMQDVWVSNYPQMDHSWPPIFRIIRMWQRPLF